MPSVPDISHFQLSACELIYIFICEESRCSYYAENIRHHRTTLGNRVTRRPELVHPCPQATLHMSIAEFGWLPQTPPHLKAVRSRRLQDAVQMFHWAKHTNSHLCGATLSSGTLLVADTAAGTKPTLTQYVKLRPSRRIYEAFTFRIYLRFSLRKLHCTKFLSLCRRHVHCRRAPGG
jgi:hypothetical protein